MIYKTYENNTVHNCMTVPPDKQILGHVKYIRVQARYEFQISITKGFAKVLDAAPALAKSLDYRKQRNYLSKDIS